MSRIAHKEDEEKLGHVDGLGLLLVLTESGTNVSSFLGNDSTFFSSGFGGTNTSDELTKALVGQCRETNIHRGWFLGRRGKEIDKKTEKKMKRILRIVVIYGFGEKRMNESRE